jgi:hypothetical protein
MQNFNIDTLSMNVRGLIDRQSDRFTTAARSALGAPAGWDEEGLAWLCMEHFQFSRRNPSFLQQAARNTMSLASKGIADELQRNFEEEKTHAEIYRRALGEVGVDVDTRVEFKPTTSFLGLINDLVEADPFCTLGAMYATETAAIFEHQVFRDISVELIARRNAAQQGKRLIGFHDMHLAGVEQAHKDNLGVFLCPSSELAVDGRGFDVAMVIEGAWRAIGAMTEWWSELLRNIRSLYRTRAQV